MHNVYVQIEYLQVLLAQTGCNKVALERDGVRFRKIEMAGSSSGLSLRLYEHLVYYKTLLILLPVALF